MKAVDNNLLIYYFDTVGTLFYSSIILYFLYIIKLRKVYYRLKNKEGYSTFFKSYKTLLKDDVVSSSDHLSNYSIALKM